MYETFIESVPLLKTLEVCLGGLDVTFHLSASIILSPSSLNYKISSCIFIGYRVVYSFVLFHSLVIHIFKDCFCFILPHIFKNLLTLNKIVQINATVCPSYHLDVLVV